MARPTPERLRELLALDMATGILTWKPRWPEHFRAKTEARAHGICLEWNTRYARKRAFNTPAIDGDLCGRVDRVVLRAHHVVFAMVNDRWPTGHVRHHDNDLTNNAPSNLYESSAAETRRSTIASTASTNALGVRGVRKMGKRFGAAVMIGGDERYLGRFDTVEEASARYQAATTNCGLSENGGRT